MITESTTQPRDGHSLLSLIAGLREDVRNLFKEELHLAKKEISEKVSLFGRNAVHLAIGGAVGYVAVVLLLAALSFLIAVGFEALGLSTGVGLFLGFLIMAVISGSVGGILIVKALGAFSKESLVPQKTIETLKEIKQGGLEQARVPIRISQPPQPEDTRSSEQIRADLELTRSRIGREVRGIRTRLSVASLASVLARQVSRNPVRTVGIGLGTGMVGFVVMRVARLFGRKHTV